MRVVRATLGLAAISFALVGYAQSPSETKTKSVVGAPGAPVIVSSTPSGVESTTQTKAIAGQAAAGEAAGFVTEASESAMAEVEYSKLALSHGADAQVKDFATRMIKDHTKANEQLMSVAAKQGIKGDAALNAEHAEILRALGKKTGPAFDRAYLTQTSADHRKAIELFQQEAKDSNPELSRFASDTLPTMNHHAKMIHALLRQ